MTITPTAGLNSVRSSFNNEISNIIVTTQKSRITIAIKQITTDNSIATSCHKLAQLPAAFTGSLLGMSQENLAWLSKEPINANMIFKKPELIDAFKGMEIAHMEVLSQDPELAQNVLYDIESIYAFKNLPAAKIPSVTNGHTIAEMAQGVVDFFKQADNALRFPIAGVNAWGDGGWKTQYGEPTHPLFPNVMILAPMKDDGYKLDYSYSIALIHAIQSYIDTFDFDSGTIVNGMDDNDRKELLKNKTAGYITELTKKYDKNTAKSEVWLDLIAAFDETTIWRLDDRFFVSHYLSPAYDMLGISKSKILDNSDVMNGNFPSKDIAEIENKTLSVIANGAIRLYYKIDENRNYSQRTRLILGPIRLKYGINNQTQTAVLKSAYRFGGANAKVRETAGFLSSLKADIAELTKLFNEQIDVATDIADSIKLQIKQMISSIIGRYGKIQTITEIKDLQATKPGFFSRILGAIFGSGEGVENDIIYPKPDTDMEEIRLSDVFAACEVSVGKAMARKAMICISAYGDFAEEYPLIAEYGLTAVSGVFQTILGGGLPGLLNFVRGEIQGAALNQIAGEHIQAMIENIKDEVTNWALSQWDDLTTEEAEALAATAVIGTLAAGYGAAVTTSYIKSAVRGFSSHPNAWLNRKLELRDHEGGPNGGHTIERHIKPDYVDIKKRVMEMKAANPNDVAKVSKFNKYYVAQDAISKAISHNRAAIDEWAKNPHSKKIEGFKFTSNNEVGYVMHSEKEDLIYTKRLKIILKKAEDGKIFLYTAYPIE